MRAKPAGRTSNAHRLHRHRRGGTELREPVPRGNRQCRTGRFQSASRRGSAEPGAGRVGLAHRHRQVVGPGAHVFRRLAQSHARTVGARLLLREAEFVRRHRARHRDLCAAGENAAVERRARAIAGIRRERRDDLEHRAGRRRLAHHAQLQRRRLCRPAARGLGAARRRGARRPAQAPGCATSPRAIRRSRKPELPNCVRVPATDASRSSHTCVFAHFS